MPVHLRPALAFALVFALACGAPVAALAAAADLTPAQTVRYQDLIAELRCVVCQNRSIAESDAPLAADMRELVAVQIAAGRSNKQIKQYFVERYGTWVLYQPRFGPATWLLWLGPGALLLIGLAAALWLWRRTRRRAAPPPPEARDIERILEDDAP